MTKNNSKQLKYGRSLVYGTLLLAAGLFPSLSTPAFAQYTVTNLVSNQKAIGTNPADPALVNAWRASRRQRPAHTGWATTAPGNPPCTPVSVRNRLWS